MGDSTENLPTQVANYLDEEAPAETAESMEPSYRVDPATKIPVSKHYGKLWEGRIQASCTNRKVHEEAWDEAVRYYNNSQLDHREGGRDGVSGNRYFAKRRNTQWSETENIVYANVRSVMPAVYAKNPQVEFTCANEEMRDFVQTLEDVVNTLASRKTAPGLNLKVHAQQAVLCAEVTNLAWLEYGYVLRENSSLAVEQELQELSQQLVDAKDAKTIREIEGRLMALEESANIVSPPGPYVRYKFASQVVVDPDATMPDFSDAKWMAIDEIYPTDYLNARYGEKQEDGTVKSIYQPTHVLTGSSSTDDDIKNFKLLKDDAEAHAYGYKDRTSLQKAYRTRCWRILDKTTRRVFLYADNKWDWPIWVENDPYGLPGFFNLRAVYFNTSPVGAYARSNVAYYLDQQDGINEIHDEWRRARLDQKENFLFDNNFDREAIEAWLKGPSNTARGVDVPEGKSLKDALFQKPNVLMNAMPLFDPSRLYQAADKVSGVTDVLRAAQFKTNTTNKAIENYNSSTAMRLDEKIDAIEDAVGEVGYGISFLCAQFMPQEDVAKLIGAERAQKWMNYTAQELRDAYSCQAVGGSTQKPSSSAKKQQALETGKILSSMTQFAPSTIIETTLSLFDEAFDELSLPPNWTDRVREEAQTAMRRGSSDVSGSGGDGAAGGSSEGAGVGLEQIAAAVDMLPPEAKVALGQAIAKGVPVAEALPEVLRLVETNTGNAQQ